MEILEIDDLKFLLYLHNRQILFICNYAVTLPSLVKWSLEFHIHLNKTTIIKLRPLISNGNIDPLDDNTYQHSPKLWHVPNSIMQYQAVHTLQPTSACPLIWDSNSG